MPRYYGPPSITQVSEMFPVMCFAHVNDANCTARPANLVLASTLCVVQLRSEIPAAFLTQVESPPSSMQAQVPWSHVYLRGNTCIHQLPFYCRSTLSRILDSVRSKRCVHSIFAMGSCHIGHCHSLIKMLELTALLTKDSIEPLALPGMRTSGPNGPALFAALTVRTLAL
jgi:hypothetical protein